MCCCACSFAEDKLEEEPSKQASAIIEPIGCGEPCLRQSFRITFVTITLSATANRLFFVHFNVSNLPSFFGLFIVVRHQLAERSALVRLVFDYAKLERFRISQ